jgi:hypothetical protein
MRDEPRERWPDVLLMLGDQVYADEVSPGTQSFIETRRDPSVPPGERVLDFEDYTQLYLESWSEPAIRWLLSTVSTMMIFDDHDVHDDWNISQAWLEEARKHEWWNEHIRGALSSYWVYQHLGNLPPEGHKDDELLGKVKAADDAEKLLEDFAYRADRTTDGARWSYCRDLGRTRLIMIDSRAGRVLEEGKRSMLDADEWAWVHEHATGGFDHLLVGTSLPWLLGRGMHFGEAWRSAMVRRASISRPRGSWSFLSVYGGSCGAATRQEPNAIWSGVSFGYVWKALAGKSPPSCGQTRSPSSRTSYSCQLPGSRSPQQTSA